MQVINYFAKRLESAGIRNFYQESIWLMSAALNMSHSQIFSRQNFSSHELAKIDSFISRRESGEPLQYILGESTFYGRDFRVGPGVLIPRQDTESLINLVKYCFNPEENFSFLDFGTGSGCIAVTILLEFANSFAYMLDISEKALFYARENISRYNLNQRSKIVKSLDGFNENINLLISNPPYIESQEIAELDSSVKDYEPINALDGGIDGMKFYREIFANKLKPRYIILETGNLAQVNALKNLSHEYKFTREFLDSGNFPRALLFEYI